MLRHGAETGIALKKKVLTVIQLIRRGGVELAAINFSSHLDPKKYEVTYYLLNPSEGRDDELAAEITKSGAKIVSRSGGGYFSALKEATALMKNGGFDAVHSHVMFFNGIIMLSAKSAGIRKRVSHSHAAKWNHPETVIFKIYKSVMRAFINICSTDLLACSTPAGEYLYGKRAFHRRGIILENGVDCAAYEFCESKREKKREELGIKNGELLVGHIGTIYRIKNQTFLLDIFAKMLETQPNARLMLAGERIDGEKIEKKARALGIEDRLIMPGQRTDIPELLQAFDIMIFPSLNEGLPVSLIEAQAAALPCLISSSITKEVKYNENLDFMPLSAPAEKWAQRAFKLMRQERESVDTSHLKAAYDINTVAKKLEKIYESAGKK